MPVHQELVQRLIPFRAQAALLPRARELRRRVQRLARLSAPEYWLWLRTLMLLAMVRARLSLQPFERLIQSIQAVPLGRPAGNTYEVAQLVWAVRSASRLVPKATCLTQALAGQKLLRDHGYPAELCIGVAKDETKGFQAHAWLEHRGEIILGRLPDHARYTSLLRRM